ncbi:MAG: DHH family phosphoesterase [Limisphaerales bacterium]
MSNSIDKARDEIRAEMAKHETFCVVGHIRPDGDCIGSQVGLALALKAQGKKVVCWNQDDVPTKLRFMVPANLVQKPKPDQSFDCVIATDCAAYDRLGETGTCIGDRKVLINIDHHTGNTRYGDLNWVNSRKPSTGELIVELMEKNKWPITPAIADCLYTAVSTDTGSFMYPTTTPETYQTAAALVEAGANLNKICAEVYQSYPLSRIRLVRMLYNNFKLTHDNQIAYFWLKKEHFTRSGASRADSEGLIDHLRDIEPVMLAVVFEEIEPGLIRLSFRSKSKRILVNKIAAEFGGGGHHAASGARVEGRPMSIQRKVIKACRTAVDALNGKNGK